LEARHPQRDRESIHIAVTRRTIATLDLGDGGLRQRRSDAGAEFALPQAAKKAKEQQIVGKILVEHRENSRRTTRVAEWSLPLDWKEGAGVRAVVALERASEAAS
jgi:hypothetical protein